MPLWTFKGKQEGKELSDVPKDYLEWAQDSSKNPEAVTMAKAELARRGGGSSTGSSGGASSKVSGDVMRARVLELAIMMQPATGEHPANPWPHLKPVLDYMKTGQLPNFSSMLTDQKQSETPVQNNVSGNPFETETIGDSDEIPF